MGLKYRLNLNNFRGDTFRRMEIRLCYCVCDSVILVGGAQGRRGCGEPFTSTRHEASGRNRSAAPHAAEATPKSLRKKVRRVYASPAHHVSFLFTLLSFLWGDLRLNPRRQKYFYLVF